DFSMYMPLTETVWSGLAVAGRVRPEEHEINVNPYVFHAPSVLAHATAALCIYALLTRLFGPGLPAAAGALIFGIHPVQVESVAWASALKDVLCGMFGALSIWQYILWLQKSGMFPSLAESDRVSERFNPRFHYLISLLCAVLSMLSK